MKLKFRHYHKLVFLLFFVLLFSCGSYKHHEEDNCKIVEDVLNRQVEVPQKIERIVGVRAGALRLLSFMDVGHLLAGIEEHEKRGDKPYVKAIPELINLPSVGPLMGGDVELIINVKPDVIFITYTTPEDADLLQLKTGIPVVALECTDLGTHNETLFKSFQVIGEVLNKKDRADSLIHFFNSNMNELMTLTKDMASEVKPSVYVGGLSYSTAYGINATHHRYAPFMFVHAKNVAASIDDRLVSHVKGTFVDIEQLLLWNPDYIFVDASGLTHTMNDIDTKPALKNMLKAIKNENIYGLLPYNNYATNYEYVLINAWYIGHTLYPEVFAQIDFEAKANQILSFIYNRDISAREFDVFKDLKKITIRD